MKAAMSSSDEASRFTASRGQTVRFREPRVGRLSSAKFWLVDPLFLPQDRLNQRRRSEDCHE